MSTRHRSRTVGSAALAPLGASRPQTSCVTSRPARAVLGCRRQCRASGRAGERSYHATVIATRNLTMFLTGGATCHPPPVLKTQGRVLGFRGKDDSL